MGKWGVGPHPQDCECVHNLQGSKSAKSGRETPEKGALCQKIPILLVVPCTDIGFSLTQSALFWGEWETRWKVRIRQGVFTPLLPTDIPRPLSPPPTPPPGITADAFSLSSTPEQKKKKIRNTHLGNGRFLTLKLSLAMRPTTIAQIIRNNVSV